jgi:hypothetical protein
MARAVPRVSVAISIRRAKKVAEKSEKRSRKPRLIAMDREDGEGETTTGQDGKELFRCFAGLFIARVAEKRTFSYVK